VRAQLAADRRWRDELRRRASDTPPAGPDD
jgi:hypothetical protein